jgi:hypothetical protein
MEFSPEELNKVRLKKNGRGIHELPIHLDLLTEKPELEKLDNFSYGFFGWGNSQDARIIARNKIIRYINFMYSMEITCIREAHASYLEQKVECAILAGFEWDPVSGKFEERVEKMLSCDDEWINRMIVSFLRHNYSDPYAGIVTLREKYYEGMLRLLNDKEASPKDIKEWKSTADDIREMEVQFLAGDESKSLNAALVMKIEEETLGLRPEDVAYLIKAGKSPLGDFEFYRREA